MRNSVEYTILDGEDTVDTIKAIFCQDFKHAVLTIDSESSFNGTVKFQGAQHDVSNAAPDFAAAQSASNPWEYVEVIDLEDGSAIDGDTGIGATGTDIHRQVEINTNGLRYLSARLTARSAGTVTVKVRLYNEG